MNARESFEVFDQLVQSVLPCGGGVVALANIYFDESGTHDGSRLMSMAGYWFDSQQAARFSRDWAKDLASFGLSHAHMTDCALGFGEYKDMPKALRVKVQTRLIEHIKRRSRFGFAICLSPVAYEDAMKGIKGAPSAYSLCLMMLMTNVANFVNAIGYDGKIAYFFEAGHAKANEANKFVSVVPIAGAPTIEHHRYAAHAFVDKKLALPLQAADMLAWHTRHYYERRLDGFEKPRKDFVALTRPFDFNTLVSHRHILSLRDTFIHLAPLLEQERMEEAAVMGDEILRKWGLPQLPTFVPRNTPVGKGQKGKRDIVRF